MVKWKVGFDLVKVQNKLLWHLEITDDGIVFADYHSQFTLSLTSL